MAEVKPLRAVHYNLAAVPGLGAVVAPPYDVISPQRRRELLEQSPFNIVEVDLPEAPGGGDPYQHAAETLEAWLMQGILTADRAPAMWALTQEYLAADGARRTRRGLLARVRITEYGPGLIRPHERTHPGPREDRLRLTEATRHNLSPIFSLHAEDAWQHLEPALTTEPWGTATDDEGTVHRLWRVSDGGVHDAIAAELADTELLIADGHHRYETARTYARSIAGAGAHDYVLMCLVSLADPGLAVLPTHRLLTELDRSRQEALRETALRLFAVTETAREELAPPPGEGPAEFGYIDSHHRRPYRLRLREDSALDEALPGTSPAYRRLDAAVLEALILRGALGMSEDDIAGKRGLAYTASAEDAAARVEAGECDAAFFLRPTPIEHVQAVAAAGETMPPKSTYFHPKVPTGFVLNPLS